MICPDENELLGFLDGEVTDGEARGFENHFDSCPQCRALVAELGRGHNDESADWQARSGGDVVGPGAQVGRYRIIDQIGAGAMGVVFRARDPELNRDVALKLVRVLGLDPDQADRARNRLLREAVAMARLAQPNVVAVHDASIVGDSVFVAMELVDGVDVATWLRTEHRGWKEIVEVFILAGRGLAAAHAAGIVHRDFKPSNLLIGPEQRVRVTDFGLAAVDGHRQLATGSVDNQPVTVHAGSSEITRSGTVMGTPAYLSPEGQRGEPVDERSDQYSFAVSLSEALGGARPSASGKPAKNKAPAAINRVIERALCQQPSARYPTMTELVSALSRATRQRSRRAIVGAVAGIAVLAAGAGFWAAQRDNPIDCATGAQKTQAMWNPQTKQATEAAFRSTAISYATDVFATASTNLDRFAGSWRESYVAACEATHVRGEQSQALLDTRMHCLNGQLMRFQAAVEMLGRPTAMVVSRAVSISSLEDGLERCDDIEALTRETPRPLGRAADLEIDRIQREYIRIRGLATEGKPAGVLEEIAALVDDAKSVGYDRMEAELIGYLGEAQWRMGDLKAAESSLFRSVAAAERARSDDIRGGTMLVLVAVVGVAQARYREGLEIARLAELALRARNDRGRLANLTANRGSIHYTMGDYDKAESDYRKAHTIMLEVYGENDPRTGQMYTNLASMAELRGEHREALETYGRALSIFAKTLGPKHPQVALTLVHRSTLQANRGDNEAAFRDIERALKIRLEVLGPQHPDIGETHRVIAAIANNAGDAERGLEHGLDAKQLASKLLPTDHPEMASVHAVIGESLLGLGRWSEAAVELRTAIDIWDKAEIDTAETRSSRFKLGKALWHHGSRKSALEQIRLARSESKNDAEALAAIESWLSERKLR